MQKLRIYKVRVRKGSIQTASMNRTAAHDTRTREIVSAAAEVYRTMGSGFLATIYREALALEFSWRGIPYRKDVPLIISYKSAVLSSSLRAQFVCFDEVIVEIHSVDGPEDGSETLMTNHLRASGLETGILFYFGRESLEYTYLSPNGSISDHFTCGEV